MKIHNHGSYYINITLIFKRKVSSVNRLKHLCFRGELDSSVFYVLSGIQGTKVYVHVYSCLWWHFIIYNKRIGTCHIVWNRSGNHELIHLWIQLIFPPHFFNTTSPFKSIPTISSPLNLNSQTATALMGSLLGCVPWSVAVWGSPSSVVRKRANVLASVCFLCRLIWYSAQPVIENESLYCIYVFICCTLQHTGVLDTTLCYKVCQWPASGRLLSPCSPVSSTNKTDQHDIAEILLKVALNTIAIAHYSAQTVCICTWLRS